MDHSPPALEEIAPRRQVCLFGLSGDPPTGQSGHLGIVRQLASLRRHHPVPAGPPRAGPPVIGVGTGYPPLFDEVRILPVYRHMFASKRAAQAGGGSAVRRPDYFDRLEMCRLAFSSRAVGEVPSTVVVCEDERSAYESVRRRDPPPEAAGTADLLEYLRGTEPGTDFALALGADAFTDLAGGRWARTGDIVRGVGGRFVAVSRPGNAGPGLEEVVQRFSNEMLSMDLGAEHVGWGGAIIVNVPGITDTSSSAVRALTEAGAWKNLGKLLEPAVADYVRENRLYCEDGP